MALQFQRANAHVPDRVVRTAIEHPRHVNRLLAHLSEQAVLDMLGDSDERSVGGTDLELDIGVFRTECDSSGEVFRSHFAAPMHGGDFAWFPTAVADAGAMVSIVIASDVNHAVCGEVEGNVSLQIGRMRFGAPDVYEAFGLCVPVTMLRHVKLCFSSRLVTINGDVPYVRGWLQRAVGNVPFPAIGSLRYDSISGVRLSGELRSPRYGYDYPFVEGHSAFRAVWSSDTQAVVVVSDFSALNVGSLEFMATSLHKPMTVKLCVKGGAERSVLLDIAGVSSRRYDDVTLVSEVNGTYCGRLQRVALSAPYRTDCARVFRGLVRDSVPSVPTPRLHVNSDAPFNMVAHRLRRQCLDLCSTMPTYLHMPVPTRAPVMTTFDTVEGVPDANVVSFALPDSDVI